MKQEQLVEKKVAILLYNHMMQLKDYFMHIILLVLNFILCIH